MFLNLIVLGFLKYISTSWIRRNSKIKSGSKKSQTISIYLITSFPRMFSCCFYRWSLNNNVAKDFQKDWFKNTKWKNCFPHETIKTWLAFECKLFFCDKKPYLTFEYVTHNRPSDKGSREAKLQLFTPRTKRAWKRNKNDYHHPFFLSR